MGGTSGSQPVTQQTLQTRDPWAAAQPHLTGIMNQAATMYGAGTGYSPFAGNTTAPWINDISAPGISDIYQLGLSEPYGSANLQGARGYLGNLVSNQGLSPELKSMASTLAGQQNPYLQETINAQMDKANSAMAGAGRYGSGVHDAAVARAIAPTLAQDYMQRQGMAADIYGQGLTRAGNAAQLIPTLDEARYTSGAHLMDLGSQQRGHEQALLDQQLKLWNAQQSLPWEALQRYQAIASGAGSLGGTQITTSPGAQQPSQMQRILGGALSGAGMGSMFGPLGMGAGAIGGGLLGMM